MTEDRQISIEGYTAEELLGSSAENVDAFVLCDSPIAFRAGTAEILAKFKIEDDTLIVEFAHIDGGGEGVLPTIWSLIERYAKKKRVARVMWIVHAVHCANPNLKLRRILELKGFTIQSVDGAGEVYTHINEIERTG